MNKFKIGDKVRILDGSKIANYTGGWSYFYMGALVGNVCTVKDISFDYYGRLAYHLKENMFIWDERGLELVERKSDIEKKIVVTTDGTKTVTARLYEGKKVIKTAEAKCSPEDEFDFGYEAALAVKRLTECKFDEEVANTNESSFKDVVDSLTKLKDTLKILKEIMQKE